MEKNIGVLVVTYNRPKDLDMCLKSIENQTYKPEIICILDNASSKETLDLLEKKRILTPFDRENIEKENFNFKLEDMPCYLKTIKTNSNNYIYLRLKENTGGSGGFYYGLKYLHEYTDLDGYYILDDDGILDENCLKEIIPYTNDYLSITSLKLDRDNPRKLVPHIGSCKKDGKMISIKDFIKRKVWTVPIRKYIKKQLPVEVCFSSFVGWYFARELVSKVGYPKKNFFIRADDAEYSLRLEKNKIKTLLVPLSKIYHPNSNIKPDNLIKYFFDFRNFTYIFKHYFVGEDKIKDIIISHAYKIFYKFLNTRFNIVLDFSTFLDLMYFKSNKEILGFLRNYDKINQQFNISQPFYSLTSTSYFKTYGIYRLPNFKGGVFFERKNKFFSISLSKALKLLEKHTNVYLLLEAKSVILYKLITYMLLRNKIHLIDRIIF